MRIDRHAALITEARRQIEATPSASRQTDAWPSSSPSSNGAAGLTPAAAAPSDDGLLAHAAPIQQIIPGYRLLQRLHAGGQGVIC